MVFAVFGQTAHFDFVNYDDEAFVYKNPVVTVGLTLKGMASAFCHVDPVTLDWVPLVTVSDMLDYQVFGLQAGGYHLTNVLLHAASAILLFLVLKKMTGSIWSSAFVAAVFAIHPLRVESVAWVAERKDVLSGLFFMLTLWAYAGYVRRPASLLRYLNVVLFFALGLMCKGTLVMMPFALLLLDYWPLQRFSASGIELSPLSVTVRLVVEKIPLLLLSVSLCIFRLLAINPHIELLKNLSFSVRLGNALMHYVTYIKEMFYPAGLVALYVDPLNGQLPWKIIAAFVFLLAVTVGVVVWRRQRPYLLAGWFWYLALLLPASGLFVAGIQPQADRYTYLPQIGLYLMVTWGVAEVWGAWRWNAAALKFAAVAILAGLSACAYNQTTYWKDTLSLWTHAVAYAPDNAPAHYNLGVTLANQKKTDEAIAHYERAIQLRLDNVGLHNNFGLALAEKGNLVQAIAQYERVLQLKPDAFDARVNLANALASQGKLPEAVEQYQQALKLKPDSAEAHNNLGGALARQEKAAEAIVHYQQAIALEPDYVDAHFNLGLVLAKQGKLDEAIKQYERSIELKPDYAQAHNNLGNVLAAQKKWGEAAEQYQRTIELKPNRGDARFNFGIMLAQLGKVDEAVKNLQQALDLAIAHNQTALAEAIRKRLKSYQSGPSPVQAP